MNTRKALNVVVATIVGVGGLFVSDKPGTNPSSLTTVAEARLGRPLTPLSVAGVARRTTRRAVVGGAIAAGALGYGYGYSTGYPYSGYSDSYGYGSGYPYDYGATYYGYGATPYIGSGYSPYYGAAYGYYRPWGFGRWW
jgi:hypothetical protein